MKAPGQRYLASPMHRFGLPQYLAKRLPVSPHPSLVVQGDVRFPTLVTEWQLGTLPVTNVRADLHCVMTWSVADIDWTGWRFQNFWLDVCLEVALPGITHVGFCGLDGYYACVPLEELLRPEVLIAFAMQGQALSPEHGAPYRLVVPQLYGYKSVKHVHRIILSTRPLPAPFEPWIAHPRGRVDLEERIGLGVPWLWRAVLRAEARFALSRAGWGTVRWQPGR